MPVSMAKKLEDVDVAIIGSGPGGYVAAIRAGQMGLKVVLVEKDPKFGGTCLHRGCIPTKVLLHNAFVYDQVKNRAREFGIGVRDVTLDFGTVQARKDKIVKKLAIGIQYLLKKNKVVSIEGYGRIKGPQIVEVSGKESIEIHAKVIIIATGSEPRALSGMDVDGKVVITNNEALELPEPPRSMLIIGAGAVGIEFASIYARFGTAVTLVEVLSNIVPLEDEEISKELQAIFTKRGIQCLTGMKVESVTQTQGGASTTIRAPDGKVVKGTYEKVLVSVGRKPNTEDIGLSSVGIVPERGSIKVNAFMQTSVPSIYAIGDVVPTPQLAHVASAEGIVAVEHAAGKNPKPMNYDRIPNVTFCDPQVGSVGLTERKARERGYRVKTAKFPFQAIGKAAILGETEGFVKIVAEERYDEILGIHVLHSHATDLIAEACAVLSGEVTVEDLSRMVHAHPTLSEAIGEAAHAFYGASIHL